MFFILALLTKAGAAAIPLVAIVVDVVILQRSFRKSITSLLPWIALAIPVILAAKYFQDVSTVPTPPLWARPIIAADSFGFYLWKLIWPVHFIPDYGRNPTWVMSHLLAAISTCAAAAIVIAIAIFLASRQRWIAGGILVFVAGIAPYSGLTTFDFQYVSTVTDRYAYVGMIGIAIFVVAIISKWQRSLFVIVPIAVVFAFLSWRQTQWWRDTDTLFHHTLVFNTRSLVAESVLGFEAKQQGRLAEAEQRYKRAIEIWPDDSAIHFGLGNLYLDRSPTDAIAEYRAAIRIQPKSAAYHNNLGEALRRTGDLRGAFEEFTTAIGCDPNYADAHVNIGNMLMSAGRLDQAKQAFLAALSANPSSARAQRGLAQVNQMMNQHGQSVN